jgi:hypothetical protein
MPPNRPPNKRRHPDIDVYYAEPEPASPNNPQTPPNVVHGHLAFETNSSGLSHNRIFIAVPGVASLPSTTTDTLIHDMDTSNYIMDTDNPPDLCEIEDDEEDNNDEYPYNWMDPNFLQSHATANTVASEDSEDTVGKQTRRKPRLPTVYASSPPFP